jgi:hypothetical protein
MPALRAGLLAGVCALVPGCVSTVGPIPRVTAVAETDGFKMLRPGARATVCAAAGPAGRSDATGKAIAALVALDPEAESVLDAVIEVRPSLWRGQECVTVQGDVVRSTRTVLLPMPGDHGDHGGMH